MPYYVQALGAELDLSAAPPDDHERARALFAIIGENGRDYSASDRDERIAELASISGVRAAVAYEGDELERFVVMLEGGKAIYHSFEDSREPHRLVKPRATFQPTVHAKDVDDVDELLERLGGADDEVVAGDDGEVELPYRWPDRDAMLQAYARAAPLLRERSVVVLAEIDDHKFEVSIGKGRVACQPLYLHGEPAALARFVALTKIEPATPDLAAEVPIVRVAAKRTSKPDPARPYTTGSVSQRKDAIHAATHRPDGISIKATLEPELAEALAAAARDADNADARFADVRRELYRFLARHAHPAIQAMFRWALEHESDDVANTAVYFAWRQEALVAELPALIDEANRRGDARTARRMDAVLVQAR